jgi:hypothetical protein
MIFSYDWIHKRSERKVHIFINDMQDNVLEFVL